jgi:dsDNA-specific endonuclease/ATPase MutS2
MPARKRTPEIVEVDLHINELIDKPEGLSNSEMLKIQKEKVESEMKQAIQTGVKKIVFIHGIGQGVLKQEVVNLLKTKFRKYSFQDASFQEYGYGATMVILKK